MPLKLRLVLLLLVGVLPLGASDPEVAALVVVDTLFRLTRVPERVEAVRQRVLEGTKETNPEMPADDFDYFRIHLDQNTCLNGMRRRYLTHLNAHEIIELGKFLRGAGQKRFATFGRVSRDLPGQADPKRYMDEQLKAYYASLTPEEYQQEAAFLRSPVGQKIEALYGRSDQEIREVVMKVMEQALADTNQRRKAVRMMGAEQPGGKSR